MYIIYNVYKAFPLTIFICYMRAIKKKWQGKLCISMEEIRVLENKTGIFDNDTLDQLKGCGAVW